ncbi:MAG: hypothetical protein P8Y72_10025 [Anaerolineales bacterium]
MDLINQKVVQTNVPVVQKVSWLDKWINWIDRLPMPAWLFYIALAIVIQLLFNITFWIDGSVPLWKNVTIPSVSPPLIILGFAFYHYLSKAASKALQNFRPLLEADDDEISRIDRALSQLPPWVNWVVLIWGIVGSIQYVFSGSNTFGDIVPQSILPISIIYIMSVFTVIPWFNQFFRIVRQVQTLQDLHQRATNINLLHLEPAHAFARLTASTGGGIILLMGLGILYNPEMGAGVNLVGAMISVFFGVLIFIAPLIGMRHRLLQEKLLRLKEISELLQVTTEQIHEKVKNQTDTDISEAKSTMSALIEERALIEKVSTWPWDTGTIRGFTSTLLLPIVLWFITRLLERYL